MTNPRHAMARHMAAKQAAADRLCGVVVTVALVAAAFVVAL